jgi:hypothetical protein
MRWPVIGAYRVHAPASESVYTHAVPLNFQVVVFFRRCLSRKISGRPEEVAQTEDGTAVGFESLAQFVMSVDAVRHHLDGEEAVRVAVAGSADQVNPDQLAGSTDDIPPHAVDD